MKVLFDTSVLVAAVWAGHPQHLDAKAWLLKARKGQVKGAISQHTLLECFATLTGMPSRPRLSPALVSAALLEAISGLETIELGSSDYLRCVQRADNAGLAGGIVYDLLIMCAAEKAGAYQLVTLNAKDFERLRSEASPKVAGAP